MSSPTANSQTLTGHRRAAIRAVRSPATVLVTDAGKGSALAIIRSLGRKGLRVIAADSDPRSPGLRSRFASGKVCYPPASSQPGAAVTALLHAARRLGVDLIIPVTDDVVLPLSAERDRFDSVCRLAMPDAAALAVTSSKWSTLDLAAGLGIPTPRTMVTHSADDVASCQGLGWPVVVKPEVSRRLANGAVVAYSVGYANSHAELQQQLEAGGHTTALVQEYCPGEGHGVEVLMDRGRVLAAFQHRRLHEVPVTGGASSWRESVPLDPVLFAHSARLLGELGWTGLAMVEFKVGPDGPRLMEVNGRVWGSLPLAVRSGMDFPARLADLYLQPASPQPPDEPDTSYAVGTRSRNLELEVVWIGSALTGRHRHPFLPGPTRREGLAAALRLVNPAEGYDILSLRDPRPGLAEARKIVRKVRRKATSHAR